MLEVSRQGAIESEFATLELANIVQSSYLGLKRLDSGLPPADSRTIEDGSLESEVLVGLGGVSKAHYERYRDWHVARLLRAGVHSPIRTQSIRDWFEKQTGTRDVESWDHPGYQKFGDLYYSHLLWKEQQASRR